MPNATLLPRRMFIDGTHTFCSGKNSGIERVVRSIVRESAKTVVGQEIAVVIAHDDRFFSLDSVHIKRLTKSAAFQRNAVALMPAPYRWFASLVCWLLPLLSVRRCLLPDAGHLGIFKIAHTIYEKYARQAVTNTAPEVRFCEGDLLLLPDAYWAKMRIWPVVEQARISGAMVASVVYDLIPITHEDFVSEGMRKTFVEYLRCLARHSDLIIAISDSVRDQLKNYLPQVCDSGNQCMDIRSFSLGAELVAAKAVPRGELQELFADSNDTPYLMVATFEPRKNHTYLLDAFELLWQTNPSLRLCLIGRVGWLCEDVLARLKQHPRRNHQLFVFHDVSDAELQFCYQSCRGVVFPSIVEGFGLPIVESLWHGQKTFASDTAIHREVGKEDCVYFDLQNPVSLAEEIVAWERQLSIGRPPLLVRQPLPWSESYQQLIGCCIDVFRAQGTAKRARAA